MNVFSGEKLRIYIRARKEYLPNRLRLSQRERSVSAAQPRTRREVHFTSPGLVRTTRGVGKTSPGLVETNPGLVGMAFRNLNGVQPDGLEILPDSDN